MPLRKVTIFDRPGEAAVEYNEEGQAKPCVLAVRWVNPTTFETIRVRGGVRTGPKGEVLEQVPPTTDLSEFAINNPDQYPQPSQGRSGSQA